MVTKTRRVETGSNSEETQGERNRAEQRLAAPANDTQREMVKFFDPEFQGRYLCALRAHEALTTGAEEEDAGRSDKAAGGTIAPAWSAASSSQMGGGREKGGGVQPAPSIVGINSSLCDSTVASASASRDEESQCRGGDARLPRRANLALDAIVDINSSLCGSTVASSCEEGRDDASRRDFFSAAAGALRFPPKRKPPSGAAAVFERVLARREEREAFLREFEGAVSSTPRGRLRRMKEERKNGGEDGDGDAPGETEGREGEEGRPEGAPMSPRVRRLWDFDTSDADSDEDGGSTSATARPTTRRAFFGSDDAAAGEELGPEDIRREVRRGAARRAAEGLDELERDAAGLWGRIEGKRAEDAGGKTEGEEVEANEGGEKEAGFASPATPTVETKIGEDAGPQRRPVPEGTSEVGSALLRRKDDIDRLVRDFEEARVARYIARDAPPGTPMRLIGTSYASYSGTPGSDPGAGGMVSSGGRRKVYEGINQDNSLPAPPPPMLPLGSPRDARMARVRGRLASPTSAGFSGEDRSGGRPPVSPSTRGRDRDASRARSAPVSYAEAGPVESTEDRVDAWWRSRRREIGSAETAATRKTMAGRGFEELEGEPTYERTVVPRRRQNPFRVPPPDGASEGGNSSGGLVKSATPRNGISESNKEEAEGGSAAAEEAGATMRPSERLKMQLGMLSNERVDARLGPAAAREGASSREAGRRPALPEATDEISGPVEAECRNDPPQTAPAPASATRDTESETNRPAEDAVPTRTAAETVPKDARGGDQDDGGADPVGIGRPRGAGSAARRGVPSVVGTSSSVSVLSEAEHGLPPAAGTGHDGTHDDDGEGSSACRSVAQSALSLLLGRIDEAKASFRRALEEGDVGRQAELAGLMKELGEAAVAMRTLERL